MKTAYPIIAAIGLVGAALCLAAEPKNNPPAAAPTVPVVNPARSDEPKLTARERAEKVLSLTFAADERKLNPKNVMLVIDAIWDNTHPPPQESPTGKKPPEPSDEEKAEHFLEVLAKSIKADTRAAEANRAAEAAAAAAAAEVDAVDFGAPAP